MRIVGLVGAALARGMRLAGFEAYECGDPRQIADQLRALASASDVGLVVLSPPAASAAPALVAAMRGPKPPLAVVFGLPEKP